MTIPDDPAFASFKAECLCEEGWTVTYNKGGITVWEQGLEEGRTIHKMKVSYSRLLTSSLINCSIKFLQWVGLNLGWYNKMHYHFINDNIVCECTFNKEASTDVQVEIGYMACSSNNKTTPDSSGILK